MVFGAVSVLDDGRKEKSTTGAAANTMKAAASRPREIGSFLRPWSRSWIVCNCRPSSPTEGRAAGSVATIETSRADTRRGGT